ncbi:MAG: hypothetical protein Q9170_003678 [Blastenia crenularia]
MTSKKVSFRHYSSDSGIERISSGLSPYHQPSAASSTETVIHHPQKVDFPPGSHSALYRINSDDSYPPRTLSGGASGIPQFLGFPARDTSATDFKPSITQQADWKLPNSLEHVLEYQAEKYAPPEPRQASFAEQSKIQTRIFDPDCGSIYNHCTACDENGGPTDCQHPKDPKTYSLDLNPIREDDPAFSLGKHPDLSQVTPKKRSPGKKFISKPSIVPSEATLTLEGGLRLTLSPPRDVSNAAEYLKDFFQSNIGNNKKLRHPHEMLSARHLSNFLTENVEEGVATSYIVFSLHGTLLGYSSPLPVKTARNIAALAGIAWRTNKQALLRDQKIPPLTGGASILKTVDVTKAEKGPGLSNMICKYKELLMAIQWIKDDFLAAALIEADEPGNARDDAASSKTRKVERAEAGSSATKHDEEVWEDEEAIEETSEDEEDRVQAQSQNQVKGQAKKPTKEPTRESNQEPSKEVKLFEKSQGLANAINGQWSVHGFKMPPGFR